MNIDRILSGSCKLFFSLSRHSDFFAAQVCRDRSEIDEKCCRRAFARIECDFSFDRGLKLTIFDGSVSGLSRKISGRDFLHVYIMCEKFGTFLNASRQMEGHHFQSLMECR